MDYSKEIQKLKKAKNAIILAHYYQRPEIQQIADFIGDSLELSKKAAETNAQIIVFCGVHFMAETAKILNPNKKVLLPSIDAGCSLADSCTAEDLIEVKKANPNHVVVSYINCSAQVKAVSDIICTSSNAEKIINSINSKQPILFVPDKNLGKYLIRKTGRNLKLWEGFCVAHEAFSVQKVKSLLTHYPNSEILAHPESEQPILELAHFIGSTSALLQRAKQSTAQTFIVATEAGIIYQMQQQNPFKKFIPAPINENNSCACSECNFMKINTIENLYKCLVNETPEIKIHTEVLKMAVKPLQKMLQLS